MNSLNFNSQDQWHTLASPSSAPGYQGCPVDGNNHSFSARRRGFPCDIYSINIDSHDDAAQLWINGLMVWEHIECCDTHSGVWTGELGPDDEVEFRVTEGSGESDGAISFQAYAVQLTGTFNVCYGASDGTVSASGFPGATYSWSNGQQTATISGLAAGEHCVTVSTAGGCSSVSQCFTINSYPQLPPLSIVPDGPTTACPGTEVELCSSVTWLPGLIYVLRSNGLMRKYDVDLNTNTLTEVANYSGPSLSFSYSIDMNPITKEVYVVALNADGERALYTLDLQSNALVELGPVFSTDGSNNLESISFDHAGNLFAVFSNGVFNKIDYNSPSLTPTDLPLSPVPSSFSLKGLTYDFDNNRLIYATGGVTSTIFEINPVTGTSNLLYSVPGRPLGVEYVGNNKLYLGFNGRVVDLTTGSYQNISALGSWDLLYVPGVSFEWSGSSGNLGNDACITVAPANTTEYSLSIENANGCSTDAVITISTGLPPVAQCVENLEVYLSAPTVPVEALDNGSSGCTALFFLADGQAFLTFDCTQLGANTVTLTATDANGQSDDCQATVTVT
ncbi:MAG: hypothetical protein H6559_33235, partial [Lewinellaceae bacterium]|nr:hypothetical protein [Lewinellaceae bacterium]